MVVLEGWRQHFDRVRMRHVSQLYSSQMIQVVIKLLADGVRCIIDFIRTAGLDVVEQMIFVSTVRLMVLG